MGIHVIQSQRIDVLLDSMLTLHQQTKKSPLDVLQAQHFIVPSPAVETWLMQKIAEKKGISANTQFHQRIRGFQWAAYQWVLQDYKDEVRKANIPRLIMQWRIYQKLKSFIEAEQNTLAENHALYPIVQRIYDSSANLPQGLSQQLKKQSMLYWVAEKVSRLFSNYMIYRGHCTRNCPPKHCDCHSNWLQAWGSNQALPIEAMFFTVAKDEHDETEVDLAAFEKQQAYELEAWQRWLWQEVFHTDFEQMLSIDDYFWQELGDPAQPNAVLKQLPKQVTVFTLLDLPPSQLQFLRRLGQYIDIYILHYNPSQEYWVDMVDPKWKARYDAELENKFLAKYPDASSAQIQTFIERREWSLNSQSRDSHHPLLTRFGKQARDHFSLLVQMAAGENGEQWLDLFPDAYPETLLGKVQQDILYLAEPELHQYPLRPDDESIQIHVCHSSLRQLEVLKDQLIHWIAQSTATAPRHASDILVLSPNLKELEPLIRSVFAPPPFERSADAAPRLSQDTLYLPIQIAGVSQLDANNAWRAVLGRIKLPQGRFSIEEFSDWLTLAATQQCYGLDNNAVERIIALLIDAGFKRGLDDEHLKRSLAQGDTDYRFSFKFALDRLVMGVAIPQHTMFQQTLSYSKVLSSDFELIGKLIQIYQDLQKRRDWMIAHETDHAIRVETWLRRLMQDVQQFIDAGVESLQSVYQIIKKQDRMLTLANFYDGLGQQQLEHLYLPLAYILEEIENTLTAQLDQAQPTGHITFSQIGQIRPLPYKLIVMLNLDSGKFPSQDQHIPFDLMQILKPQMGDRSRLVDDQGAFLDALLLARENLWLFYNGFDVSDGEARDPSTVLNELIQHLDYIVESNEPTQQITPRVQLHGLDVAENLQALYHIHSLQPFDAQGFYGQHVRFKDQWYKVAQQIHRATQPRQSWSQGEYPKVQQEIQVLDSNQWMKDTLFPARAYLKALGVKNLNPQDLAEQLEPLLLNPLNRYSVRDFLMQHEGEVAPELLKDVLPVGKTQHATWQLSLIEQENLQSRLHAYADSVTETTQQILQIQQDVHVRITVPKNPQADLWVSMQASSAKPTRRSQIWLQYLFWLAYLDAGDKVTQHRRVVICSDKNIVCQGMTSTQAKHALEAWFAFWQVAQQRPVLLPAELALAEEAKLEWDEEHNLSDVEKLFDIWNQSDRFAGYSFDSKESNIKHVDWAFILQNRDKRDIEALIAADFQSYAYALYQPLLQFQSVEEL